MQYSKVYVFYIRKCSINVRSMWRKATAAVAAASKAYNFAVIHLNARSLPKKQFIFMCLFSSFSLSTFQPSNRMDMAINVTKMPLNRPNRSPSSKKIYINEPEKKKNKKSNNNNTNSILHRIDQCDWVNIYRVVNLFPLFPSFSRALFSRWSGAVAVFHHVAFQWTSTYENVCKYNCIYFSLLTLYNFVIIFHKYSVCGSNLLWQTIEMQ